MDEYLIEISALGETHSIRIKADNDTDALFRAGYAVSMITSMDSMDFSVAIDPVVSHVLSAFEVEDVYQVN